MMTSNQQTLAGSVSFSGCGIHSGSPATVELHPAPPDSGINFRCGHVYIPAHWSALTGSERAVSLSAEGATVSTVEHLLAALAGCGVSNCLIDCTGGEIPDPDGTAAFWMSLLQQCGVTEQPVPRRLRQLPEAGMVRHGESWLQYFPGPELRLFCGVSFAHAALADHWAQFCFGSGDFAVEVAGARTLAFWEELRDLWKQGLALGGTFRGTLVFDSNGQIAGKPAAPDECARHKLLDLSGDLMLFGEQLTGTVIGWRSGHRLHTDFVRRAAAGTLDPVDLQLIPAEYRSVME